VSLATATEDATATALSRLAGIPVPIEKKTRSFLLSLQHREVFHERIQDAASRYGGVVFISRYFGVYLVILFLSGERQRSFASR
jgi:hypothetical protein